MLARAQAHLYGLGHIAPVHAAVAPRVEVHEPGRAARDGLKHADGVAFVAVRGVLGLAEDLVLGALKCVRVQAFGASASARAAAMATT